MSAPRFTQNKRVACLDREGCRPGEESLLEGLTNEPIAATGPGVLRLG